MFSSLKDERTMLKLDSLNVTVTFTADNMISRISGEVSHKCSNVQIKPVFFRIHTPLYLGCWRLLTDAKMLCWLDDAGAAAALVVLRMKDGLLSRCLQTNAQLRLDARRYLRGRGAAPFTSASPPR